jgi:hypothetical protein
MPKLIYLDVSALSRPFDDQDFMRIRLETEAVNLILSKVREGGLRLLVSSVHWKEIDAIQDVIVSCDEKLLKKCLTHKIKVWCGNPVSFCEKEGLK